MSEKEILKKLLKIAENQQKIISKLAQVHEAPPNAMPTPAKSNKAEAATILAALPPQVKSLLPEVGGQVGGLEVHPTSLDGFDGEVRVAFLPGKASNSAVQAITKVVQDLYDRNMLHGRFAVKPV